MHRQREKGIVTMMSRTERAVRMKAVMPGSLSSAAREKRKRHGKSSGVLFPRKEGEIDSKNNSQLALSRFFASAPSLFLSLPLSFTIRFSALLLHKEGPVAVRD